MLAPAWPLCLCRVFGRVVPRVGFLFPTHGEEDF